MLQVRWIDRDLAIVSHWSPTNKRFQALQSSSRTAYACGDVKPNYPVPALVPEKDFTTYEGTWGKPMRDAKKFFACIGTEGGINWTWAHFLTMNDAIGFDSWCTRNAMETRGVYPAWERGPIGVRYR